MNVLRISDFCETGSGGTPNRSRQMEYYDGGTIPWVKSGELTQRVVDSTEEFITEKGLSESSAKLLQPGAILVAMYGATVGQVSRLAVPAATNQAICHIYPDEAVCVPEYLYRVLKGAKARLLAKRVGGGQPNISQKIVRDLPIPLPPLAEQKRIAKILDAADALRTKRRESLTQLDTLVQSTFLDMFGDPVTNPMGWDNAEAFESWLDNIDSGWSPRCLDRKALHDEWGVLKLGAVTWCEFDDTQQKALPSDQAPRPEIEVTAGDLLFARKNTHELVAAAAYVHHVRPRLMLPDLIFRIRLKPQSEIDPKFLWQLLIQPHQRQTIQKLAGGAAGSMPNISKTKLKRVRLIKPPFNLQQRFAAIVDSVYQQKNRQRTHLDELDTLFASLQYRAFRGDLT